MSKGKRLVRDQKDIENTCEKHQHIRLPVLVCALLSKVPSSIVKSVIRAHRKEKMRVEVPQCTPPCREGGSTLVQFGLPVEDQSVFEMQLGMYITGSISCKKRSNDSVKTLFCDSGTSSTRLTSTSFSFEQLQSFSSLLFVCFARPDLLRVSFEDILCLELRPA